MQQPKRIELPSGGWWEFKPQITHGDWRYVEKQAQVQAVALMGEFEQAGLSLSRLMNTDGNGAGADGGEATPLSPGQEDALLQRATTGWSFPEPVTDPAAHGLREEPDVRAVLAAMVDTYQLRTRRARSDEGKERSGALSSSGRRT